MNHTKIEWTDYTWNPITGCLNGCPYCYARKISDRFHKSFKPEIHYDRLSQPLKENKPSKIFVCSMSDFWGKGVPPIWREEVYNIIKACPNHTFQLLTKQPQNITGEDRIPENCWVGVSVSGGDDGWKIGKLLSIIKNNKTFLSYEPVLSSLSILSYPGLDWIIIGGLTPKPVHDKKHIDNILTEANNWKIPIFIKDNANYPIKRKEFPEQSMTGER